MGSFPLVTSAATIGTMMDQRGVFPNGVAQAMKRAGIGTSELARIMTMPVSLCLKDCS